MKMANKAANQAGATLRARQSHQGYHVATPLSMGRTSCFVILCLTCVPLHLVISLTGITSANTATEIPQALPQDSLIIPEEPNIPLVRQLLQARISVAEGQGDKQSKSRLMQMIEQVRSVQFGPQKQTAEPPAVPQKAPVTEPNETSSAMQVQREAEKKKNRPGLSCEPVTGQTLQMLMNRSQHPDKLDHPFELAEILFSSGNLKDAAAFYQQALARTDPKDAHASADRAWILFQIGNCLRDLERPTAAKTYGQLLTEYPESAWTDLARAEGKLIEWYLKDEPRKLIGEAEHPPSK